MWRFVLPGAGVVGMTLLLLAGSLASWTFGGGGPSSPSASPPPAATTAPAKPAAAPTTEEDAMKLALAALASGPPSSAPAGSAGVAPPPDEPVPPASPAPIAPSQPTAPADSLPPTEAMESAPPAPPSIAPRTPAPSAASATASTPSPRLLPSPSSPEAVAPAPAPSNNAGSQAAPVNLAPQAPAGAGAPPSDQADPDSFASVESLIHRLRTAHRRDASRAAPIASAPAYRPPPGERLATARALLASGQTDQARPLLEGAAAQLQLGPAEAYPLGSSAAARVDDALRWLNAGQPARAINLVDAAIAALDPGRGLSAARADDRRFATQVPAPGPDSGLW